MRLQYTVSCPPTVRKKCLRLWQRRKAGTGCATQLNEKLWEGRYSPIWPDGKKHARNVYAHSEEECERLLAEMMAEMKAEIAAETEHLNVDPKAG